MTLKPILLACLAIVMPGAAHAQYQMVSPMLYNGPRISLQDHANRSRQTTPAPTQRRNGPAASALRAVPGEDSAAPVDMASMRYRPDMARRSQNMAQFVSKMRQTSPEAADDLSRALAGGKLLNQIQAALGPVGLRIDDVADAYSTYWINAYQATRGNNDTPSRHKMQAVKQQAARALAATAEFRNATDANKQEIAESLWVQAALLDGAVEQAKGNPDQMRAVGQAAAQGARGMGLDFSGMTLTEDGFVSGREVGAVEDKAGTVAVAKADANTTSYMLLAALGGTGVGGALMFGKLLRRKAAA